jgi:hypothetical protein
MEFHYCFVERDEVESKKDNIKLVECKDCDHRIRERVQGINLSRQHIKDRCNACPNLSVKRDGKHECEHFKRREIEPEKIKGDLVRCRDCKHARDIKYIDDVEMYACDCNIDQESRSKMYGISRGSSNDVTVERECSGFEKKDCKSCRYSGENNNGVARCPKGVKIGNDIWCSSKEEAGLWKWEPILEGKDDNIRCMDCTNSYNFHDYDGKNGKYKACYCKDDKEKGEEYLKPPWAREKEHHCGKFEKKKGDNNNCLDCGYLDEGMCYHNVFNEIGRKLAYKPLYPEVGCTKGFKLPSEFGGLKNCATCRYSVDNNPDSILCGDYRMRLGIYGGLCKDSFGNNAWRPIVKPKPAKESTKVEKEAEPEWKWVADCKDCEYFTDDGEIRVLSSGEKYMDCKKGRIIKTHDGHKCWSGDPKEECDAYKKAEIAWAWIAPNKCDGCKHYNEDKKIITCGNTYIIECDKEWCIKTTGDISQYHKDVTGKKCSLYEINWLWEAANKCDGCKHWTDNGEIGNYTMMDVMLCKEGFNIKSTADYNPKAGKGKKCTRYKKAWAWEADCGDCIKHKNLVEDIEGLTCCNGKGFVVKSQKSWWYRNKHSDYHDCIDYKAPEKQWKWEADCGDCVHINSYTIDGYLMWCRKSCNIVKMTSEGLEHGEDVYRTRKPLPTDCWDYKSNDAKNVKEQAVAIAYALSRRKEKKCPRCGERYTRDFQDMSLCPDCAEQNRDKYEKRNKEEMMIMKECEKPEEKSKILWEMGIGTAYILSGNARMPVVITNFHEDFRKKERTGTFKMPWDAKPELAESKSQSDRFNDVADVINEWIDKGLLTDNEIEKLKEMKIMKKCEKCNGEAPGNASYCPHCGLRFGKKKRFSKIKKWLSERKETEIIGLRLKIGKLIFENESLKNKVELMERGIDTLKSRNDEILADRDKNYVALKNQIKDVRVEADGLIKRWGKTIATYKIEGKFNLPTRDLEGMTTYINADQIVVFSKVDLENSKESEKE